MLVVAIFVVFFCQCQGFAEQVPDTATIQNDQLEDKLASLLREQESTTASLLRKQDDKWASLLKDQEAKTASLLREQDENWASLLDTKTVSLLREQDAKLADLTSLLQQQGQKLSDQEHLLHKQEQKLSDQEHLLHKQEQKLSDQEQLFHKQEHKLSDQEQLLHEQEQKLSDQEQLLHKQEQKLSYQARSHRQLEQKVFDQEDLLRHQDQKLSHQESLLKEQGARLSYQEALLLKQGRTIQQLKNRHAPPQSFPSENLPHETDTSQSETPLHGETSDSASHDVIPRSDDGGPWEAVVSHISQRVTEMGADIQSLKNSNRQQDLAIQDAQSSTFVHWGSSKCSNLSNTVYSGVVGGSWYKDSGAATNYLCLTMSPVFSDHAVPTYVATLYGGEYQNYDSHHDKDPVCAVCRPSLSTTVMIPGTNVCTPGWHLQYSGFLMAGYYGNNAGSEYICVDYSRENTVHGDANEGGKLSYFTVTRCGSLPCSPYVNNKVVTCAVCSK